MADRRILVVDDDDDVREITRFALEVLGGWDVTDVDRGATALAVAARQPVDVVLLDVMMPDMDGPTTFRLLRANPATSHIPVILLTAKVQGSAQLLDELDVAGLISKPFDPMRLTGQIDALLAAASGGDRVGGLSV